MWLAIIFKGCISVTSVWKCLRRRGIQQKLEIIEQFKKGKCVKSLSNEYSVGEQTVRDMIKKKEEYLKFACSADSSLALKKRKTMKKSIYGDLDKAKLDWFSQ